MLLQNVDELAKRGFKTMLYQDAWFREPNWAMAKSQGLWVANHCDMTLR